MSAKSFFVPKKLNADNKLENSSTRVLRIDQIKSVLGKVSDVKVNPMFQELFNNNSGNIFSKYMIQLVEMKIVEAVGADFTMFCVQMALNPKPNEKSIFYKLDEKEISFEILKDIFKIDEKMGKEVRAVESGKFPYSFYQKLGLYGAAVVCASFKGNSFYNLYVKPNVEKFKYENLDFSFFCSPLMLLLNWSKKYKAFLVEVAETFYDAVEYKYSGKLSDPNKETRDWAKLIHSHSSTTLESVFLTDLFAKNADFQKFFDTKTIEEFTEGKLQDNPASTLSQKNEDSELQDHTSQSSLSLFSANLPLSELLQVAKLKKGFNIKKTTSWKALEDWTLKAAHSHNIPVALGNDIADIITQLP